MYVGCCSVAQSCSTLCDPMDCSAPGLPVPHHLLEFPQSSCSLHRWYCPAVSSSWCLLLLPSAFPSIRDFSNGSVLLIRWPKYWSFSFRNSPSSDYLRLISFRTDWFDLLLSKGLSRVFSSTTVQKHQFFSAQPPLCPALRSIHDYWKNHTFAITIGQVTSLLFNMLSRLVIVFLPRIKCLLISWLQPLSSVILEPKKIKSVTAFTFPSIYLELSDGTRCQA